MTIRQSDEKERSLHGGTLSDAGSLNTLALMVLCAAFVSATFHSVPHLAVVVHAFLYAGDASHRYRRQQLVCCARRDGAEVPGVHICVEIDAIEC